MPETRTYTIQEIQDLLANLDSFIPESEPVNKKMKRVKLPIPPEYGGGVVRRKIRSHVKASHNIVDSMIINPTINAGILPAAIHHQIMLFTSFIRSPVKNAKKKKRPCNFCEPLPYIQSVSAAASPPMRSSAPAKQPGFLPSLHAGQVPAVMTAPIAPGSNISLRQSSQRSPPSLDPSL